MRGLRPEQAAARRPFSFSASSGPQPRQLQTRAPGIKKRYESKITHHDLGPNGLILGTMDTLDQRQ